MYTGWAFCEFISACMGMADLRRAGEWSHAARTWCERLPTQTPNHGLCRAYRVELGSLRGAWAEAEGLRASEELLDMQPSGAAEALCAVGEIGRKRGDAPGAEEAFRRAHQLGRDPAPGEHLRGKSR